MALATSITHDDCGPVPAAVLVQAAEEVRKEFAVQLMLRPVSCGQAERTGKMDSIL